MNKETETAREESIKHWVRMMHGVPTGEGVYAADCALCNMFYEYACNGCPVSEYTGQYDCHDTPWRAARDAVETPKFYNAAYNMVEFLKSLRESENENV
jgi:hypothetical protein